jgi:phage FluMu protein Com
MKLKIYKNAKETIRKKVAYTCYYYEYTCPFCKTVFRSYKTANDTLMIRCSCGNKIKFKEELE